MTLHLRRVPTSVDAALKILRAETTNRLRNEIAEKHMDAKLPRHFQERQQYIQTGGN